MKSATSRATELIRAAEERAAAHGGTDRLAARCFEAGALKSLVYQFAGELDAKNLPMTDDDGKFVDHIYEQINAMQIALSRRELACPDAKKTATSAIQIALDGLSDLLDEMHAEPARKTQEETAWEIA